MHTQAAILFQGGMGRGNGNGERETPPGLHVTIHCSSSSSRPYRQCGPWATPLTSPWAVTLPRTLTAAPTGEGIFYTVLLFFQFDLGGSPNADDRVTGMGTSE
jgi:hypothetical protein